MSRNCFSNWGKSGVQLTQDYELITVKLGMGRQELLLLDFYCTLSFPQYNVFKSECTSASLQGEFFLECCKKPKASVHKWKWSLTSWPNWLWQLHYRKRNHRGLPQKKQGRGEPNHGSKVIPSVRWLRREQRSQQSDVFPIWDHGLATSSCY